MSNLDIERSSLFFGMLGGVDRDDGLVHFEGKVVGGHCHPEDRFLIEEIPFGLIQVRIPCYRVLNSCILVFESLRCAKGEMSHRALTK